MAFDIQAWGDYGVAMVGAAAVLVGLLFFAASANRAWFSSSEAHELLPVRASCSSSSRSSWPS